MANLKISQLPSATTPLSGTEEIAIVQNNQTVKTTTESIRGGYKVYTALLTQSGGDGPNYIVGDENIYKGITYEITLNDANFDFAEFGSPNNTVGTKFVSTKDGVIATSGDVRLDYNTGAPVVTVLENTIGNIWWAYNSNGEYFAQSDGLFTINKTFVVIGTGMEGVNNGILTGAIVTTQNQINIQATASFVGIDDELSNTSFEIRVYN